MGNTKYYIEILIIGQIYFYCFTMFDILEYITC